MKDRVIVLVTDAGFLVPTMQVVEQILGQTPVTEIADIAVYLIDIEPAVQTSLREQFPQDEVRFVAIGSDLFELPDGATFHETHVPPSTLARLAIAPMLPTQYEHIVYLDGDTQIVGDIRPLIAHSVTPGKIAAASDASWICAGDRGEFWSQHVSYLAGLGIHEPRDYFNAGVLAARRETWLGVAADAMSYFLSHSDLCRYHDQSALNAVCLGRREVLSPAYNFMALMADAGIQGMVAPRIIHFTGPRKPWFYDGPPWNGRFISTYTDLIARRPSLSPYFRRPADEAVAAMKRRYQRPPVEALKAMRRNFLRQRKVRSYLDATPFAVSHRA